MAPSTEWTNSIHSTADRVALPQERSLIFARDEPNPFSKDNPKSKTPTIAGTVCGGVVFLAWTIGFAIYFRKRYRRRKRKRLAEQGKAEHPDAVAAAAEEEAPHVVVPPDPAVLLGYDKDGHRAGSEKGPNGNPTKG